MGIILSYSVLATSKSSWWSLCPGTSLDSSELPASGGPRLQEVIDSYPHYAAGPSNLWQHFICAGEVLGEEGPVRPGGPRRLCSVCVSSCIHLYICKNTHAPANIELLLRQKQPSTLTFRKLQAMSERQPGCQQLLRNYRNNAAVSQATVFH